MLISEACKELMRLRAIGIRRKRWPDNQFILYYHEMERFAGNRYVYTFGVDDICASDWIPVTRRNQHDHILLRQ